MPVAVTILLSIHAGLLAYAATRHSPTLNEPGHLVAGLSYWEFGRFEVYRVNPPLTRLVAALPVLAAGYEMDWSRFHDGPGARPEFALGEDFVKANGERSIWLFTIARWACIPISVIGGIFSFLWGRELYGAAAGLVSLALWCTDPNILAHAELITPDAAATTFGVGAGYTFWRWLKQPTWSRAGVAGLLLGFAEFSKMSWLLLFGLWPVLWIIWQASGGRQPAGASKRQQFFQLAATLLLGLYVLNLGYVFDGSFTQLKKFTFVSETLAGEELAGDGGNRFADSWLGELPVPLPEQYLLGFDSQKRDFEDYGQPSYLRGEWRG
ncbi:MAG: glycosyltransferase family 39 protein, partial [Planctomycetota bacterium]|nr:glycosyltransferase family 39 protein [Planctomycetota bacterium]